MTAQHYGIILAVLTGIVTVLKGDKVWAFLKHILELMFTKKIKLIEENKSLKKKLKASENSNTRLKKLLK